VMFSADELDRDQREALERLVELYVDRFGHPSSCYCTRSIAGSGSSPRYSTHALLTQG
jgi:hypothetical protein